MTKPLGKLLSESWSVFQKYIKAILVGAVVFAVIIALAQGFLAKKVQGEIASEMGVDFGQIEELAKRASQGDESALKEMMELQAGIQGEMEGMTKKEAELYMQNKAIRMFKGILPEAGMSFVVIMLLYTVSFIYYLLLPIKKNPDPVENIKMVPKYFFPVLGVAIWTFIRTFVWIPIIGFVFLLILGPRFVLSQVVLIKDKKGVLDSVSLSYKGTKGYWGKIVGNMIIVAFLMFLVMMGLNIVVGLIGAASVWLALFGQMFVSQLVTAYASIFGVLLAFTIMENPKKG